MQTVIKASLRDEQGTGASRRLRRSGKLPAIIYGADKEAQSITLDHNELYYLLKRESFHASVLTIDVGGDRQLAVLRNTQWHPFRQQVLHIDFNRIVRDQKMHIKVPLHFINEDKAPGVKLDDGLISHVITEVDVSCLPEDLPEYIEVDLQHLTLGHSVHLSELVLPKGVEVVHHGEGDPVLAAVLKRAAAVVDAPKADDAAGDKPKAE